MQIVCPLRETEYITVQLTPNQVATLAGLNNIYADSGDIKEVEYFNNKANDIARMIELISGKQVDLIGTLATGQTSLTIQNDVIKTDSTIEVFTDPEVDYNSITVTAGSITITFDAQASDVSVKVRIS